MDGYWSVKVKVCASTQGTQVVGGGADFWRLSFVTSVLATAEWYASRSGRYCPVKVFTEEPRTVGLLSLLCLTWRHIYLHCKAVRCTVCIPLWQGATSLGHGRGGPTGRYVTGSWEGRPAPRRNIECTATKAYSVLRQLCHSHQTAMSQPPCWQTAVSQLPCWQTAVSQPPCWQTAVSQPPCWQTAGSLGPDSCVTATLLTDSRFLGTRQSVCLWCSVASIENAAVTSSPVGRCESRLGREIDWGFDGLPAGNGRLDP